MHHIFYHANCADGFAARCIAQLALGTANVAYWPIQYEGPQMSQAIEPRDQVTYLDYTPPPSILEKLITEMGCRVLVIDHHDTAKKIHEERLVPWESIFAQDKSGAGLAWEHYFPGQPMPANIGLVQFRDLGKCWSAPQHLKTTAELAICFQAYVMRCIPRTFEAWQPLLLGHASHPERSIQFWHAIGRALVAQDRAMIEAAAPAAIKLQLDGYTVPGFIGFPYSLVSDGLNHLLQIHFTAPFAANVYPDPKTGRLIYSLRSTDDRAHVGEIAKRLDPPRDGYPGGGGHHNAAGFSSDSPIPFVLS